MNGKMIVFSTLFMLTLLLVMPVMAAPTSGNKVDVQLIKGAEITQATVCPHDGVTYPYPYRETRLTPGEISQRHDVGMVRWITLIIDGTTTLVGKSYDNYDRTINFETYPSTYKMMIYHNDAIWDFPTANGGFEGNINMQYTDFNSGPPLTYQVKFDCVLQGYGSFEGQTLQFSYRGITGQTWEGYLLTPK